MEPYWWLILIILLIVVAAVVAVSRRKAKADNTAMEAYVEGLRSIISGDHQTAFIKLKQAVEKDTENIDAYLKMGDLFREKGMTDKAFQIHRELTLRREVPADLQVEIKMSLAIDYIEAGMIDKAIDILQPITKNGDHRIWAEDRLLDLYLNNNRWKEAEELYRGVMKKRGIKENPTMANIKIMVGRDFHDKKEFHKARRIYKEALPLDRKNPLPYLYIAESYMEENRIEDGLEFLKRLCDEVPQYAYIGYAMMEQALFDLGRFGEVEDIYRGVLSRDSDNIPTIMALAGILEKKGEIPSADALLRPLLDSANPAAAIKLAKMLSSSGRTDEGLEILAEMADKIDIGYNNYNCKNCGGRVQELRPSCPKCGRVGTFI